MEANHGVTFERKEFIAIYKDGELAMVEELNGSIKRWVTKKAAAADSYRIYDLDKMNSQLKN
jgi:hypothetical protein